MREDKVIKKQNIEESLLYRACSETWVGVATFQVNNWNIDVYVFTHTSTIERSGRRGNAPFEWEMKEMKSSGSNSHFSDDFWKIFGVTCFYFLYQLFMLAPPTFFFLYEILCVCVCACREEEAITRVHSYGTVKQNYGKRDDTLNLAVHKWNIKCDYTNINKGSLETALISTRY